MTVNDFIILDARHPLWHHPLTAEEKVEVLHRLDANLKLIYGRPCWESAPN